MDYLFLFLGGMVLIVGARIIVSGAAQLASNIGVPNLVIGLTIVAFGTSAPELAVSISSSIDGKTELAVANVVGSNIFNTLFIIGLASIISPLLISKQIIYQDLPIMILISIITFYMSLDGIISILESGMLVLILFVYTIFLLFQGKNTPSSSKITNKNIEIALIGGNVFFNGISIIIGLSLLLVGSHWFVNSAVNLARIFGLSEAVIGLTILAIGTSLPEVITSIVAAIQGQRDIAVGNVIGSNTFNLLAVIGFSGLTSTKGLISNTQLTFQDFPIMLIVALLCIPIMITNYKVDRLEGVLFVIIYIMYAIFLIATELNLIWLSSYLLLIVNVVIPLILTIIVLSIIKHYLKLNDTKM